MLTKSADPGSAKAREYLSKRGFSSAVAKTWQLGYAPGRGAVVRYLTQAGFSADEVVSANLGLAGDGGQVRDRFYERIMFPIHDLQGRTIAFGGRVIEPKEPKYLNTQDTPIFHKSANMYAIDRAKASITSTGTAIVVEGYTDVIALHEAGLTNAVATLGTALTREHVRLCRDSPSAWCTCSTVMPRGSELRTVHRSSSTRARRRKRDATASSWKSR